MLFILLTLFHCVYSEELKTLTLHSILIESTCGDDSPDIRIESPPYLGFYFSVELPKVIKANQEYTINKVIYNKWNSSNQEITIRVVNSNFLFDDSLGTVTLFFSELNSTKTVYKTSAGDSDCQHLSAYLTLSAKPYKGFPIWGYVLIGIASVVLLPFAIYGCIKHPGIVCEGSHCSCA